MPSGRRVILGIIAAAMCAPILFCIGLLLDAAWAHPPLDVRTAITSMPFVLLFGFLITIIPTLLFALPAYLLLRLRWPMRWWHAGLAGAAIGAAPIVLSVPNLPELATWAGIGMGSGLVFRAVVGPDRRLAETPE